MVTMRLLADARADLGDVVGAYDCCASLLRYLGGRRLALASWRRFAESWESTDESESDKDEAVMCRRQRRDSRRDRRRLATQRELLMLLATISRVKVLVARLRKKQLYLSSAGRYSRGNYYWRRFDCEQRRK